MCQMLGRGSDAASGGSADSFGLQNAQAADDHASKCIYGKNIAVVTSSGLNSNAFA